MLSSTNTNTKQGLNSTNISLQIDGLVQERPNSNALAMELRLSGTKPIEMSSYRYRESHCVDKTVVHNGNFYRSTGKVTS